MMADSIAVEAPDGNIEYGQHLPPSTDDRPKDDTERLEYFLSAPGHTSVDCPFMSTNPSNIKQIDDSLSEKMEQLEGLLPDNLRDFYKFIGSSTQEIYIKYWTLFSIDNIIERRKIIMEDGIEVTDFGMRYCGMGHCKIAFYDKNTGSIYYRADGGSNGWDRAANYENLKKYESDNSRSGLTFKDFMNQIKTGDDSHESMCIF